MKGATPLCKKATLTNAVHRSSATCTLQPGGYITPRQVRRMRHQLCCLPGCTCEGILGEQGPQAWQVTMTVDGGAYLEYVGIIDREEPP
jgi:hypothetical protein